jgi:Family of unknown function (DUF5767)
MASISLRDMENEVRTMSGGDISLSNDIGNVIELNDINDTLGLNMLANPKMTSGYNDSNSSSSNNNNNNSVSFGLADVEVSNFEPLNPISINLNETQVPLFEVDVKKEQSSVYSNMQTSSAPSFSLDPPQSRVPSEAEKKEKMDYLNKLQRLEQKGFPVSRRYTMDNSLDEVRDEYNRLYDARNLEASLRFQRQALMGIVTGIEWANGKFDPFDVKLDGWSESVHENVEDFDEIFEELYDKYKERGKMPPEARLVMALAGSGFMCHVSNTFLRSRMPNMDDVLKNNPDIARQFAGAAASAVGPGFGNFMNAAMNTKQPQQAQGPSVFMNPPNAPAQPSQQNQNQQRREMRGPTGVDDILKTFEEARRAEETSAPQGFSSIQQPASAAAVELQSVHSEEMMSQAESTRTGRGGGRRKRVAVGNSVSIPV